MVELNAEKQSMFPRRVVQHVLADTSGRVQFMASQTWLSLAAILQAVPLVASASNDSTAVADANYLVLLFDFYAWRGDADAIRGQPTREACLIHLSQLLSSLGPVRTTEISGTAGALSLLPTAGALIGAPAKELWVLFKLMPLAGVLSMILSLGGNIVPSDVREYTASSKTFSYGGLIATAKQVQSENYTKEAEKQILDSGTEVEKFAARVRAKARRNIGSRKRTRVAIGILLQLFWIGVLIGSCWFVQTGGIIVWWCQAWYWMFFWYLTVVIASLLENYAGVPFTEQWTIRASRAPRLRISEDAPVVVECSTANNFSRQGSSLSPMASSNFQRRKTMNSMAENMQPNSSIDTNNVTTERRNPLSPQESQALTTGTYVAEPSFFNMTDGENGEAASLNNDAPPRDSSLLLENLKKGYNIVGGAINEDGQPLATTRVPFYVIISVEGVQTHHALLRVVSKALSVGVFASGTAFFASSTLITISVALTSLCLILGAGVFGRVTAMWMANEMIQDEPVLHKVVKDQQEAGEYVREVLAQPGVLFEIMGHVIVNGRCVGRYSKWFRWSTYFGLLAPPFNVSSLMT